MLERRRAERHMAKFAAGARLFAVKMKISGGNGKHLRGLGDFPYEVDHRRGPNGRRGTQRKSADGPKMVFKLARHCAFDGPVPRVMNPWSHLVCQQLAITLKKFDSENAHII